MEHVFFTNKDGDTHSFRVSSVRESILRPAGHVLSSSGMEAPIGIKAERGDFGLVSINEEWVSFILDGMKDRIDIVGHEAVKAHAEFMRITATRGK